MPPRYPCRFRHSLQRAGSATGSATPDPISIAACQARSRPAPSNIAIASPSKYALLLIAKSPRLRAWSWHLDSFVQFLAHKSLLSQDSDSTGTVGGCAVENPTVRTGACCARACKRQRMMSRLCLRETRWNSRRLVFNVVEFFWLTLLLFRTLH
jgi:hypothetical protein